MDCEERKEKGRKWTVERGKKTGGNGLWRGEGKREGLDCVKGEGEDELGKVRDKEKGREVGGG